VRVSCPDLFGDDGVRVVPQRTSNAYHFSDPSPAGRSDTPKSEKPTRTPNQDFFSPIKEVEIGRPCGRSTANGRFSLTRPQP
jgi:hypothetical protein